MQIALLTRSITHACTDYRFGFGRAHLSRCTHPRTGHDHSSERHERADRIARRKGKHYRIERPLNLPQSLTRPHPPILIAGSGEQKTLRLVARYADACNLQPGPQIPKKLEVLRQHCRAEGRDYNAIEKTCMFAFDVGEHGSKVGELIGQLRWLAEMGIQTVLGVILHLYQITPLEVIGREVIPVVADF